MRRPTTCPAVLIPFPVGTWVPQARSGIAWSVYAAILSVLVRSRACLVFPVDRADPTSVPAPITRPLRRSTHSRPSRSHCPPRRPRQRPDTAGGRITRLPCKTASPVTCRKRSCAARTHGAARRVKVRKCRRSESRLRGCLSSCEPFLLLWSFPDQGLLSRSRTTSKARISRDAIDLPG